MSDVTAIYGRPFDFYDHNSCLKYFIFTKHSQICVLYFLESYENISFLGEEFDFWQNF